MNWILKILALVSCLFLIPIGNVFAQESYEFDFDGNGIFAGTWTLGDVGDTLNVDIWLDGYECPPSDTLFGAQLYFGYDPAVLQVNDAYPNDSNHGGPFDPNFSSIIQRDAGVYYLTVGNLGYVTVTENKIKLGTIQLERIILGDTQVVAANDLGGLYTDGFISDCNLASQYPSDANAVINFFSFCRGLADFDQDVDGTDAFMFKKHFGRSSLGNPCPPDGPAPVPKTGQITSYHLWDDGDLGRGVAWPQPRFTDNGDETVTDNLTGLMWTKDARPGGSSVSWDDAFISIATFNLINFLGYSDWRLPNLFELESLRDMQYDSPALSNTTGNRQHSEGDPFINVWHGATFWSSTSYVYVSFLAFNVSMTDGTVSIDDKTDLRSVWPVRGGH